MGLQSCSVCLFSAQGNRMPYFILLCMLRSLKIGRLTEHVNKYLQVEDNEKHNHLYFTGEIYIKLF